MIGNSEGKLKGRGIASLAVPAGALGKDKSNLPVLETKLQKKSRKGYWQNRYFRANNHYLIYFKKPKMQKICCCHDLCKAVTIETSGRFGYFEIEFQDDVLVSLKAKDLDEAEAWVDNLLARRTLFNSNPSKTSNYGTSGANGPSGRSIRTNTGTQGGIMLEGYLSKKSPARFRGWQPRYFILGNGLLRYYKTKPEDDQIDESMQGAVHVAGVLSIFNVTNDKECLSFVLKTEARTFELKASNRNECKEWIRAIDEARSKMQNDAQALEETVQEVEMRKATAALPQLIQIFDATDSNERAESIMMHVITTFESHGTTENNEKDSLTSMVKGLTDCLEQLNDIVDTCTSVDPIRHDIIQEHIQYYHGSILFKVNAVQFMKEDEIKAHEALRVMDFVNAYSDLLKRASAAGADVASFNADDDDKVKDMLTFLTGCYVSRAAPELENMCHNVSSFVINSPDQAIRENNNMYQTTAPIDLNNMMNRYVEVSGRGGLDSLQARVFSMCLDGIVAYHHDVELHVTGMSNGEHLVFLCAIANDAETFSSSMESFEDEFIDLIEQYNLEDDLEMATTICLQLGSLALHQMEYIIFLDINVLFDSLFDKNWINGNDDTMNDICTTFHDYFDDFSTRCNPRTLVKLIGICYNRLLIEYIGHLIQVCTKKNRKTGSRSVMVNESNIFSPSIFKVHDITESIRLDLQNAKIMFEEASETAEHRTGRSFRHQTQLDGWFQDLIYRTHVEDIHENIFRPMCSAHKKNMVAFPHIYCFVSQLTLLRDYKWDVEELGLSKEEMKHLKKPPARIDILNNAFSCLHDIYEMKIADITTLVANDHQRAANIALVIKNNDFFKSKDILKTLLINEITLIDDHRAISILKHHEQLYNDDKITQEQLNARSVQEAKLLQLRATNGGSLITRVCSNVSNVLEQIKEDESMINPKKKKSVGKWSMKAAGKFFAGRSTKNKSKSKSVNGGGNRSSKGSSKSSVEWGGEVENSMEKQTYKMLQEGTITKEEYDKMMNDFRKAEMAQYDFDDEKRRLEKSKSEKLVLTAQEIEIQEQQLHIEMAIKSATDSLAKGLINQKEFDQFKETMMAAHCDLSKDLMDGSGGGGSGGGGGGGGGGAGASSNDVIFDAKMVDSGNEGSGSSSGSGSGSGSGSSSSSESDDEEEINDSGGQEVKWSKNNEEKESAETKESTKEVYNSTISDNSPSATRHRGLSTLGNNKIELLRGYMMKKAKTMSQWRKRWFTVKRVYDPKTKQWCLSLCWHEDHNSPAIRSVPIEMLSEVTKTEQKLTFKIIVIRADDKKKRVILLKAENSAQQDLWVGALTDMIHDVKARLKHAFLNDTSSPSRKRSESGRSGGLKNSLRGKSARTSVFAMPAKSSNTGIISPGSAGRERPELLSCSSLIDSSDYNDGTEEYGSGPGMGIQEVDEEDGEPVSIPASQGCGCVVA